jgi:3-hydroxybutyryl-CoA dehydrogenase
MTNQRTVTVVGAGTMGTGIAQAALSAGYEVLVFDVAADALVRSRAAIAAGLSRSTGGAQAAIALQRLTTTHSLSEAAAEADIVIEAATENEPVKFEIFTTIGAHASSTALLATNTSTMSVTQISQAAGPRAGRVVGMHFFNPVHRMKLIEIITGEHTEQAAVDDAAAFASDIGKEAIFVRDVPGFVTSRLGLLLGNAAMRLVEEGVASAADVDKAMRLGYGHPMGPLELADLVGLDARLNNLRSMATRSGDTAYQPPAILVQLVDNGRLGRKTNAGFYDYPGDADGAAR